MAYGQNAPSCEPLSQDHIEKCQILAHIEAGSEASSGDRISRRVRKVLRRLKILYKWDGALGAEQI